MIFNIKMTWENNSPEEVLYLIGFQEKFNNKEFDNIRFINFIVELK